MDELEVAKKAAKEAGNAVMKYYMQDYEIKRKEDATPVTAADLEANNIILKHLKQFDHGILSEETPDNEARLKKQYVWIIDPIDGTKKFMRGEKDFTVNIGLAKDGQPVLGVVYAPALDLFFYAKEDKAWLNKERIRANVLDDFSKMVLLTSRGSHKKMAQKFHEAHVFKEVDVRGSSLLGCLVASGDGDLWIKSTQLSEWDICAMHAVINGAGAKLVGLSEPITYNKKHPKIKDFVVCGSDKAIEKVKEFFQGN